MWVRILLTQTLQRVANRTLRQGILTISEISGFAAVDAAFEYDKKIRDAVTLLSLSVSPLSKYSICGLLLVARFDSGSVYRFAHRRFICSKFWKECEDIGKS